MVSASRECALQILNRVYKKGAYANIALSSYFEHLEKANKKNENENIISDADKALATELVYGTLRRQSTIDFILIRFLSGGEKGLNKLPQNILTILRMGVYQIFYMDKIPDSAAVNESVNLAKKYGHKGTAGLVNGVLRGILRHQDNVPFPNFEAEPVEHISICESHPQWLVEYWLTRFSAEDVLKLAKFDNIAPPVVVRANTIKNSQEELVEKLENMDIKCHKTKYSPYGVVVENPMQLKKMGLLDSIYLTVQQESSQLASMALSPKPGAKVIDACAAPGGKTTHLAELMGNRGEILAFDLHPHKIQLIEENAKKLGHTIIKASQGDASKLYKDYKDYADFALCDVPCSGLGVLRNRADSRFAKSIDHIKEIAGISYEILESVSQCVKNGGVLLYSTCTLTYEENEGNIKKFLTSHPNWHLEEFPNWNEHLPQPQKEGMCEILPFIYGIDGFFIARLRRED